ncbi:DUF4262 domain-containing protein [Streptomyces sp. NPDC002814]
MSIYDDNTNWGMREPAFPLLPDHNVIWVHDPDGDDPPFTYTLGLSARPGRAYEMAAFGLPMRLALSVMGCAAEQLVRDGSDPAEGLELDEVLAGGYLVRLRLVRDTTRFEGVAPAVPFWQVVVPDKWGYFPGDPHYRDEGPYPQLLP